MVHEHQAAAAPATTNLDGAQRLLSVERVSVRFGGVLALQDVSFGVRSGEICALIGPNGAGKTTLFNCIGRVCRISSGAIRYGGIELTQLPRHDIIGLGVARTFQNVGLVPSLTVLDNVLLGAHAVIRPSFWRPLLPRSGQHAREASSRDEALSILDWLRLAGQAQARTGELPFGTLKRIELARALLARPKLLLLDEPANGLAHGEVAELADLILEIRARFGVSVLLVEHHMGMVLRISDSVAVLNMGQLIAHGTAAQVRNDPAVVAAYLGEST